MAEFNPYIESLTVRVQIDGKWTTLTYNSTSGKYEGSLTAPNTTSFNLTGGYYPATIEVVDEATNKTIIDDSHGTLGGSCRLIVKEVAKPTITFISPSAGSVVGTSDPEVTLQLRDEDNGSGIRIDTLKLTVDGTVVLHDAADVTYTKVTNGYDVSYAYSSYSDGPHTIKADVSDNDGNTAVQKSITFTIDTTPPVLSVSAPADGFVTKQTSITVTGVTNDEYSSPVTVKVTVNGIDAGAVTVDGVGSFSKDVTVKAGVNTIVIRSTDKLGKFSEVSRNIKVITTPPTISKVEIIPSSTTTGSVVTVKVSVTDLP